MSWLEEVFFPLNRPEYARTPEMLASALARDLTRSEKRGPDSPKDPPSDPVVGYVFEKTDPRERKTLQIRQTRPVGEEFQEWVSLLRRCGLEAPDEGMAIAGNVLLDSLRGITAARALGRAAVPLVPGTALLQDARGMHAKKAPPNYGRIFNQMYVAGSEKPTREHDASVMWFRTASKQSRHPTIRVLDEASRHIGELGEGRISLPVDLDDRAGDPLRPPPEWLSGTPTPFEWFRCAWDTVCLDDWRRALPRRRWADWATTVLRTALGLGFLWEARFYRALAQQVLSRSPDPRDAAEEVLSDRLPLLDWKLEETPLGIRDVNSRMRRVIIDGVECRAFLGDLQEDELQGLAQSDGFRGPDGLSEWIAGFRAFLEANPRRRDSLADCFGRNQLSRHANVIETVRYALSTRREFGPEADFYGLLRTRSRRFRVVQPGPEWIVVIASLAGKLPGNSITLRELRRRLAGMGLRPQREVLVRELEQAGLTQSSHDADDAIRVSAGFAGAFG